MTFTMQFGTKTQLKWVRFKEEVFQRGDSTAQGKWNFSTKDQI